MRIGVLIKRVPDTEARIRLSDDNRSIDEKGIEFIINPYDEIALECALQLKEKYGGEVVLICYGPSDAPTVIRKGLAMGADSAVHIEMKNMENEPAKAAKILAPVIKEGNYDIIFCGKQAIDDDSCQTPSRLSVLLGLPCVTEASKLDVDLGAKRATVHKEIEGGVEVVEVELPAIITAQKGLVEPRLPSLKGIMAAKKKPIATKSSVEPEPLSKVEKFEYPPSRPPGKKVGEGVEAVPKLVELLKNEAKVI
ncbi:MAG: electron transfer flavoprotein subunit beta/FixA family protein [Planctomycetota bacterium]|nr:electron transfer flavoprotein subunit beta/FixA family protein [Planctomycetota bacterium]